MLLCLHHNYFINKNTDMFSSHGFDCTGGTEEERTEEDRTEMDSAESDDSSQR